MAIEIRQSCDSCGNLRVLRFLPADRFKTVNSAGNSDGWREVGENKHLCPHCIERALKRAMPPTGKSIIEIQTTLKEN